MMFKDWKIGLQIWLDEKLIPEWEKAWKMLSVQGMAVMGVLTTVWLSVPDEDRSALASMVGINPGYLIVLGLLVNVYLRLRPQPKLHPEDDSKDKA
jgi:hypothetical protein